MTLIPLINKVKIVIYSSYVVLLVIVLIFIYFINSNYQKTNLITPQKIQIHATKLDVNQFNRILEQIKFGK